MAKKDKKPPKPFAAPPAPRPPARLADVLDRFTGARLCYGEPIRSGVHTVIPVAAVHARGGGGGGTDGGGGGGVLDASPIGFIDLGPDGARFERIADPERSLRIARGAVALVGAVAGAVATAQRLRGGRRAALPSPRRLLGR